MRDSGEGGYSGTDWSAVEPIDMWLAIGNQDTSKHWQVVSGWQKSADLIAEHLDAVTSYQKNLAAAWPPETSAAAEAYLARLKVLVNHLEQTHTAAKANHDALYAASDGLDRARASLSPIIDEYYANQAKLAQFTESQSKPSVGMGKSVRAAPKPPVADGRQEQLAAEARSVMYGLGAILATAKTQISEPKLYTPNPTTSDNGKTSEGGGTSTAPILPAVVPFDPHSGASTSNSRGASAQFPTTHSTNSSGSVTGSSGTPAQQPGLILGGVGTSTPVPPVVLPPTTGSISPSTLPGVIGPGALVPGAIGFPSSTSPPGSVRGLPGETVFDRGGFGGQANSLRAMAPGGVIGGEPGLGRTGMNSSSIQRVNPVGGVINPAEESTTRGVVGGPMGGAAGQPLGGASGRRRGDDESIRWDPDNPWETAEGVDPVVLPAREQRIDPGPAIGLD
jgi:hypothetical protein